MKPGSRSPIASLSLVRFLLDRIDEDEHTLERLARHESRGEPQRPRVEGIRSADQLRANLIAKRHVIGDLQHLVVLRDLPVEAPIRQHAISAMCAMASIYRDHPAFRPEWAHAALVQPEDTSAINQQRPA